MHTKNPILPGDELLDHLAHRAGLTEPPGDPERFVAALLALLDAADETRDDLIVSDETLTRRTGDETPAVQAAVEALRAAVVDILAELDALTEEWLRDLDRVQSSLLPAAVWSIDGTRIEVPGDETPMATEPPAAVPATKPARRRNRPTGGTPVTPCDETPTATKRTCGHCGQNFVPARTGRPPRWCSQRCRQAAHGATKRGYVDADDSGLVVG